MADLLVQAHSGLPVRFKTVKPSTRVHPKSIPCKANIQKQRPTTSTIVDTLRGANDLWLWWKDGMSRQEREVFKQHEERKQILCARMKAAETIKQWEAAARELDALEGNDDWKHDPTTADYNKALIEQRLRELDEARANCDIRTMMHLIRTALSRDLGGMGNVDLYRHSYVGTKKLIERYVESTIETINAVVNMSALEHGMEYRDLLEGMLFSRQSFGRSALLLSGGGTFGMTHIGVIKALFDAKLLPRIISGASAGSIVCAVLCTRTDEEVPDLLHKFPYGDLAVFESEDNKDGILDHLRRLLTEGSWSDIKHLTRVMRELTGDLTFQEAYNRTRRILNIPVSTESVYELPRLLNYVTAPNVMIWSAVAASCSVPFIFNSSCLLVKDPVTGGHSPWNPTPHLFIDGSVDNDLPMTRLSEMFNVNHFIVSQVNPHVAPFLSRDDHLSPDLSDRIKHSHHEEDWLHFFTSLAKDEALHRLHYMAELGIFPNIVTKLQSILSQKYSGDINILPETPIHDLPRLLKNPTTDFMLRACLSGERATWPKLSRVRDQCAIELALDRAVHQLRTRVVFSESQRDLPRLRTSISSLRLQPPVFGSLAMRSPGAEPQEARQKRTRTRTVSGSNLAILPIRRMLLEDAVTDEDTAEEEIMEMKFRRGRTVSPVAQRKPRVRRGSKSHAPLSQRANQTTPADEDIVFEIPNYNFSKPLTPPKEQRPSTQDSDSQKTVVGEVSEVATKPWCPPGSLFRAEVTSPTDDNDTSGHESSDAYGEQGTEESDLETSDIQRHPSPKVPKDHSASPSRTADGGLWD